MISENNKKILNEVRVKSLMHLTIFIIIFAYHLSAKLNKFDFII